MDQLCRADHLTAKTQARYHEFAHTHSQAAHTAVCMQHTTHTQLVSHQQVDRACCRPEKEQETI
jgi:hypothetical protein